MGDWLTSPPCVGGVCAWGQGRDSTWDWERLVCEVGWRLGGPFLFLEGWWGTQVSRASWACRPGPVRAQIAGCFKRREAGREGSGGVRRQLHVPAARPGQAPPVPPAGPALIPCPPLGEAAASNKAEAPLPHKLRVSLQPASTSPSRRIPWGDPSLPSAPRVLSSAILRPSCPQKAMAHGPSLARGSELQPLPGPRPPLPPQQRPRLRSQPRASPAPGRRSVSGAESCPVLWGPSRPLLLQSSKRREYRIVSLL